MGERIFLRDTPIRTEENGLLLVNPATGIQLVFFTNAMRERNGEPYAGRKLRGPQYETLIAKPERADIRPTTDDLRAIARTDVLPVLQPQRAAGFTAPRHFRQQSDGVRSGANTTYSKESCMNACFRMVFDDITGWTTDPSALRTALLETYQEYPVYDPLYLDLFHSEEFKRASVRKVETCYIKGADFTLLGNIAVKAAPDPAANKPGADAYCITTLGRPNGSGMVTHEVVLLSVTEDTVTYHDPSFFRPQAHQTMPKGDFVDSWALTRNAAMFVVAHSATTTGS